MPDSMSNLLVDLVKDLRLARLQPRLHLTHQWVGVVLLVMVFFVIPAHITQSHDIIQT